MERPRGKPTVLIVDDNGDNCALAQATLEDDDCSVMVAMSGPAALKVFETKRPDLRNREIPESARAVAQRIRADASGPLGLIMNLLDIAKGEEGLLVPHIAPVDPVALASAVCEALQTRAFAQQLSLKHDVVMTDVFHADVEMREQVFERFVQLEAENAEGASRAGRGLGLAFCKLVAEAHGGRIWIEDGAPGAVFCLRLPQ